MKSIILMIERLNKKVYGMFCFVLTLTSNDVSFFYEKRIWCAMVLWICLV